MGNKQVGRQARPYLGSNTYHRVGNEQWKKVDGELSFISVGNWSEVWGVNKEGEAYRREGMTSPTGSTWKKEETPRPLKQLDVFDGNIWGVAFDGGIWHKNDRSGMHLVLG